MPPRMRTQAPDPRDNRDQYQLGPAEDDPTAPPEFRGALGFVGSIQRAVRNNFVPRTDGDFYDPSRDAMTIWREWTPEQAYQVQNALAAAGYIGEDDIFEPGNFRTTREQFSKLLGDANDLGVTWQEMLNLGVTQAAGMYDGPGGGSGRQAPTYTAPNRNDLQAAIKRGLYSQFGTYDNAVDVDSLVDQYLAMHRSNFDAQVGLAMGGGGGSVEDVESLEGFVERRAREEDPMGVESRDFLDRANQFFDMLGGVV